MAIEYLGLSSINGPLIALEGVQDAFYDEIVDFVVNGKEHKMGRIVEVYKDKAIIQVFEGTENMSLNNTHTDLPDIRWKSVCPKKCLEEPLTESANRSTTLDRSRLKRCAMSTDFR